MASHAEFDLAAAVHAVVSLQRAWRGMQQRARPPDMAIAKARAAALMPHSDSGLPYQARAYAPPFGRVRGPSVNPDLAAFDRMGVNVGLYMRLLKWLGKAYAALTLAALVVAIANMTGGVLERNFLLTSHTLGNTGGDAYRWLHAVFHALLTLGLLRMVLWMQLKARNLALARTKKAATHKRNWISAADYSLYVQGITFHAPGDEANRRAKRAVRAFFEQWGEVVAVSLPRDSGRLITRLRKRSELELAHREACAREAIDAKQAPSRTRSVMKLCAPSPAKIEAQLRAANEAVERMQKEQRPLTGAAFVTFNEQRAAHACLKDLQAGLRDESAPALSGVSSFNRLTASFARHPNNVLWENLGHSAASRRRRSVLVIFILLCQVLAATVASYAAPRAGSAVFHSRVPDMSAQVIIMMVTNYVVNRGLDEDITFFESARNMIWTTLAIIASNVRPRRFDAAGPSVPHSLTPPCRRVGLLLHHDATAHLCHREAALCGRARGLSTQTLAIAQSA